MFDIHSDPQGELASEQARESLGRACATLETDEVTLVTLGGGRIAAILSNCERRGALSVANQAISELGKSAGRGNRDEYRSGNDAVHGRGDGECRAAEF